MNIYKKTAKLVNFGAAIRSRITDELETAFKEGDLDGLAKEMTTPCLESLCYSINGEPVTQITMDNFSEVPEGTKRMAPLYAGLGETGELREEIPHGAVVSGLIAHYSTYAENEFTHVNADAASLYLIRDTDSGILIQRQLDLPDLISKDAVRTCTIALHHQSTDSCDAATKKYALMIRQLRQAINVAEAASLAAASAHAAILNVRAQGTKDD